jgi:hypothetical protein
MKANPTTSALALGNTRVEPWRDPEWQRLWLAIQERPWRSLAVIPAGNGGPPDFSVRIAVTLARTGMVHLGSPVQVADATKVPLAYLASFTEEVRRCVKEGDLILVALAPVQGSPVTISIAQSTDAAVLCVLLEHMESAHARRTVAEVGHSRFVGSVILRGDSLPPPPPSSRGRK